MVKQLQTGGRKRAKMKSNAWVGKIRGERTTSSHLPLIVTVILLLSGGGIGMLLPSFISKMLPYLNAWGGSLGTFGPATWGLVGGALMMAVIIILRQDEIAATAVIAASIVLDWYLHTFIVGLIMALVLLLIFFLGRSPRRPWTQPRALWLWVLFLVLIIFSAMRGATTIYEVLLYYSHSTVGALIMFWLGAVITRDVSSFRRFLKVLGAFGTLIAIHAIIQETTGTFLFWEPSNESYFASLSYFILLPGLDVHRVGSFFLNPDWAGPFFAFMLCITLSLSVESASFLGKCLYLTETSLMTVALLFTYTYGAWIGTGVAIIVLVVFIGRMRYRVQLSLMLFLFIMVMLFYFSFQLDLFQRRFDSNDAWIRVGAWQTALRVISAFPLTGVGLGLNNYLERAEPYRVPAQFQPLDHPLNSYLEFGTAGGLPLLLVFVALLSYALWMALRNWARADARTRALLGGCIAAVISLSVDSLTNNVWTFPALAALGWLILGVISSPLLSRKLDHQVAKEQNP